MTDKELRKLSRLELLELLLKESRENEKLRQENEKLKSEKSFDKTTEQLKETAVQFGATLQNADALVSTLQKLITTDSGKEGIIQEEEIVQPEASVNESGRKNKKSVDVDLYRRLLLFYAHDISNLEHLPAALHIDVAMRLAELLKK